MRKTMTIVSIFLAFSAQSLAYSSECLSLYSRQIKKPLHQTISERLLAEPNSYPEFVIAEVLREDFLEISNRYENAINTIGKEGTANPVKFSLITVTEVLNNFSRVSKLLNAELDKEKRNDKKIQEQSLQLKTCVANFTECSSSIAISLTQSKERLIEAQRLLLDLEAKQNELTDLNAALSTMNIPSEITDAISRSITSQSSVVSSYMNTLATAIALFKSMETQLRISTPDIHAAQLEVALLQARGAKINGSLDLKTVSALQLPGQPLSTRDYSTAPRRASLARLVLEEYDNINFSNDGFLFGIIRRKNLLKPLNPTLPENFSRAEIGEFLSTILRKEGNPKEMFNPVALDAVHGQKKFIAKDLNLHFLLFLIEDFKASEYKDNIQWLIREIDRSANELEFSISDGDPKWTDRFFNRSRAKIALRVELLRSMKTSYEEYLRSVSFLEDFNAIHILETNKEPIKFSGSWVPGTILLLYLPFSDKTL